MSVSPPRWSAPWRFASAPAATLVVALVQLGLNPDPGVAPFVFLYVGPVLAAWVGGRLPGLLAVALSAAVGNFAFLGPPWGWATSPPEVTATALFLAATRRPSRGRARIEPASLGRPVEPARASLASFSLGSTSEEERRWRATTGRTR